MKFLAIYFLASFAAVTWQGLVVAQLDLSFNQNVDVSFLGFNSIAGSAFDSKDETLWISDGTSRTNLIVEINPFTAEVLTSFTADVIPGFGGGQILWHLTQFQTTYLCLV